MTGKSSAEILEFEKVLSFAAKYAITVPGRNKVLALVPFQNIEMALYEGGLVTEAKELIIQTELPPMDQIPDLYQDISMSKVDGASLSGKKLLSILHLAQCSRLLYQYIKSNSLIAPQIADTINDLFVDKILEKNISDILDDSGEVRDSASRELRSIRAEVKDKNFELRRMVERISKNLSGMDILREEFLTLRDGRVVLPVKVEHKRQIRGFIHSESATGQTVYIEPEETLHLNNELISLSFAEKREIERILRELTKRVGQQSYQLVKSLDRIAFLDSLFARAQYSIQVIGAFPRISDTGTLSLQDARHPILLQKIGRDKSIPLNIEINQTNRTIVITGPNAGGKTVVLKSLGLLTLMVFAGIHIPASPDSEFPIMSGVFVDIGDRQSIEDDLSTFSSHLSNIKNIIEQAGDTSLVLLDELGTGTDPSAAAALGTAILLTLQQKNAFVLTSTHHGDLKILSHTHQGFQNAAMEFDTENLTPTYRLKQGLPGSSYAFEIVKRIGYPDSIIDLAKQFMSNEQNSIEKVLVEIETQERKLRDKVNQAERENARLKGLSSLYQSRIDKLEKEKNGILKKTKEQAESFLNRANKEIESAIKEVRESQAGKTESSNARKLVASLKENLVEFIPSPAPLQTAEKHFEVHQFVRLSDSDSIGKIIEIDRHKKTAKIAIGAVTMSAAFSNLQPADKKEEKLSRIAGMESIENTPSYRLDIRGQKPEIVEFDIIKFIDSAYTNNFDRVEILHGKGTGVLKKLVRDILKEHIGIKSFYFAPVEFGGEGITIVEFKS